MMNLLFVLVSLLLLTGFVMLTRYEARRGERLFAGYREELDKRVLKILFVLEHVDWGGYVKEEAIRIMLRLGHDIAHVSLRAVRAMERLLTTLVRHLRSQNLPQAGMREPLRPFVKTLADFKGHLEATRPMREESLSPAPKS